MRQNRRVSFAAPFVMVVGALVTGCGGAKKPVTISQNPPPPSPMSIQECQALVEGAACEGTESCSIDPDCPTGFTCQEGKWVKHQVACNPPPPQ